VATADGAETISDIAVLADQTALFGRVASDSTCQRLLDALDEPALARVAASREIAWAQRADTLRDDPHGVEYEFHRSVGRECQ
jgi:hypothetical protein